MRTVIAVVMGMALASVGIGMLRSLGGRTPHQPLEQIEIPAPDMRVTFWCENCGTELLLIRKGSENPPRHCGEPMVKREEVARS